MPFLARAQEQLTITTYYPSPYGSYNELSTASNTYLATSGGSVGIGTSNPGTAKLAVIGGNVGIGTTTPQVPLHISYADYGNPGSTSGLRVSSTNGEAEIQLDPGGAGSSWTLSANDDSNLFRIFQDTTERLRIDDNGNVGIGMTTNPESLLHVYNSASSGVVGMKITRTNASYGNVINFFNSANNNHFYIGQDGTGMAAFVQDAGIMATWSLKPLIFATNQTERVRIKEDGNVGIGTVNPTSKIEVINPSGTSMTSVARIYNANNAANNNGLLVETASSSNNDYLIRGIAAGTQRFVITQPGYLRIGGSGNPGGKFEVVGLDAGPGTNTVTCSLVGGAYRFYQSASSLRYKDKIQDLKEDFYKILNVKPKSFVFKASGIPDIGYIAEDFDEAGLKKLVAYNQDGQPESVKYDKISLYIIEVLKDQQKVIARLKAENEALRQRLENIENKIAQK